MPNEVDEELHPALAQLEAQTAEIERDNPEFYAEALVLSKRFHAVLGANSRECIVVASLILQRDMAREAVEAEENPS